MHLNRGPYVTLLPNSSFLSATTLTIAAGVIIFVVGFCGCVGAMMESQCMLVVVSYHTGCSKLTMSLVNVSVKI